MTSAENSTAIRNANSTEYLRYPMLRDVDPSGTSLSFTFKSTTTSDSVQSVQGNWHFDDTEEQDCQFWYARALIGPDGLALAAGIYSVVLTVETGSESALYALGYLLVVNEAV